MIQGPESMDTALKSVKAQRRMTAHLRRLELITEMGFLTSFPVMLCGWLVVSPEWQPLVKALMPLGLGITVMRKSWFFVVFMLITEMAAILLFPGGSEWDIFYVLSVVPITLVTGWAYRTRQKAVYRWLGTVAFLGLSQYLIAQSYYFHPIHTLTEWSIRPLLWILTGLQLDLGTAWAIKYWVLGFIIDQVFWGTGIFWLLTFFGELEDLSISQVPLFGRWRLPPWVLWILLVDFLVLAMTGFKAKITVPLVEVAVVSIAAYAVVGANVLWRIAELAGLPKVYRVALLGLWAAGSGIGFVLLALIGIYESIWHFRDYALTLRRF